MICLNKEVNNKKWVSLVNLIHRVKLIFLIIKVYNKRINKVSKKLRKLRNYKMRIRNYKNKIRNYKVKIRYSR